MDKNKPSSFTLIENDFSDIIVDVIETDQTGKSSSMLVQRRTYKLINGTKLYITEFIKDGNIDISYYDIFSKAGESLMKFHSEPHENKNYQTATEPYHIHGNEKRKLTNQKRFSNESCKSLYQVMEFLRLDRKSVV